MTRRQLLVLGMTSSAIDRAIGAGRLHPVMRGVYAVGRPVLSREGHWLAAVLCCGPGALLSHGSAAALWGIGEYERGHVEVSIPASRHARRRGVRVYRRSGSIAGDAASHRNIPVTSPIRTLIDLAPRLSWSRLEAAINAADVLGQVDPDVLRDALSSSERAHGASRLREILDRRTFRLTESELERRFLRLVRDAGLPAPDTGVTLNGFRVDFYWPDLRLVVETDGLRYHRTPAQQARDRLRDQAHTAAGLTPLRFTHEQVRYQPAHVRGMLVAVAHRLAGDA